MAFLVNTSQTFLFGRNIIKHLSKGFSLNDTHGESLRQLSHTSYLRNLCSVTKSFVRFNIVSMSICERVKATQKIGCTVVSGQLGFLGSSWEVEIRLKNPQFIDVFVKEKLYRKLIKILLL